METTKEDIAEIMNVAENITGHINQMEIRIGKLEEEINNLRIWIQKY